MDFIALDLETTGTLPYVDRIVEVAAVLFKDQKVFKTYQTLVNPEVEISEEVTRINQITNEMVAFKPLIQDVLSDFSDFCKDYPLVAHNASFDFQFLRSSIEKYKTQAPTGIVLDTYQLAKKLLPGLPNYKLGSLVKYFKIKHGTLHRAEEDATCCGYLFQKLLKKSNFQSAEQIVKFSGKEELKFPQVYQAHPQLRMMF